MNCPDTAGSTPLPRVGTSGSSAGRPPGHVLVGWAATTPTELLTERLTADDERRLRRLHRPADQDRFATARVLARQLAATWMDLGHTDVALSAVCPSCGGQDHGRPRVTVQGGSHGARPVPQISLAHADELVVVAVTDAGPVGIDCEPLAERLLDAFDDVVLHPSEAALLRASSPPDPTLARVRYWVRKEAVLKATGHGLAVDPRRVAVSDWSQTPAVLTGPFGEDPRGWQLRDLDLRDGYLGAIAVRSGSQVSIDVTAVDVRGLTGGPA